MNYESVQEKNGKLLDLFSTLEDTERIRFEESGQPYERLFQGVATITHISTNSLRLKLEGRDRKAISVKVPTEISSLATENDQLMMAAGKQKGAWHIIQVDFIGSFFGDKAVFSGRNPLAKTAH